MLLRDCPVGSVVRLVSVFGEKDFVNKFGMKYFEGEFVVERKAGNNVITDKDGDTRYEIYNKNSYQFEVVSLGAGSGVSYMTLEGITYKLTPITERKKIEIDGVVYEMDDV